MVKKQQNHVKFVRDPELKRIEARFSRYTREAFKKHSHDTYAIGVVEQGESNFFYRNTTETITKGQIALINPGEVHACNPKRRSVWAYKMFYVDIDLIREIACEISETDGGFPLFTDVIVDDASLYQALVDVYTIFQRSPNTLEKDSFAHEVFSQLVEQYSDWRTPSLFQKELKPPLQRAYEYLMENLAENISLHQLSSEAGLSAYHLLRAFRARFGLPPHTFQLQQRINVARRILAEGFPIAEVAFELGFTDQSHFTKKFKMFVGATPRQYQLAGR